MIAVSRLIPHLGLGRDPLLTFDSAILVVNTGEETEVVLPVFEPAGRPWPVAIQGRGSPAGHVPSPCKGHSLTVRLTAAACS